MFSSAAHGIAPLGEACCLCLDDHAKLASFNRKDLGALVMFQFFYGE